MDRLMKETETLQHQAKAFKIDADQFAMALQQQQVSHVWTPIIVVLLDWLLMINVTLYRAHVV